LVERALGKAGANKEYGPFCRVLAAGKAAPAMAAAAAIIIAVLAWPFLTRDNIKEGTESLNVAYRSERPVEGRISGLAFAQYNVTRGNGVTAGDKQAADRARANFELAVAKNPAAALHAMGRYYLATGDRPMAIDKFEAALKIEPSNASVLSDLGLAYLEKAKHEPREPAGNEDLKRSLDFLNRAIAADGNLLDALFNRALVYRQLGQTGNERQDWQDYIAKDPKSGWGRFASDQLKKPAENPQQ